MITVQKIQGVLRRHLIREKVSKGPSGVEIKLERPSPERRKQVATVLYTEGYTFTESEGVLGNYHFTVTGERQL